MKPVSICPVVPVGPEFEGRALENIGMFVDILPRGFADVVGKASKLGANAVIGGVENSCGYEAASDAILELEDIGSRLMEHVKTEDLLFVLSESAEALVDFLSKPFELASARDGFPAFCRYIDDKKDCGEQEYKSVPRAIVVCKFKKAETVQELFWGEEKNSSGNAQRHEVTWGEFQKIKKRLGEGIKHVPSTNGAASLNASNGGGA